MTTRTHLTRTFRRTNLLPLLMLVVLAVACDGTSTAQVIATHRRPEETAGGPVVQDAQIELEVRDANAAAEQAARLVAAHGGYIVDSQSWYFQGREQVRMTARVPAAEFASFYRALLRLGIVVSERVTEVVGRDPGRYTRVSVTLRTSERSLVPDGTRGWHPVDTLGAAFAVFMRLFRILIDGLIWIAVVAGPFLLMALGLVTVVRRLRRGQGEDAGADG